MPAQSPEDRYTDAEAIDALLRDVELDAFVNDILDAEAQRAQTPGLSPEGELYIRVYQWLVFRERNYYHVDGIYYASLADAELQRHRRAQAIVRKITNLGQHRTYLEALEHGHRDAEYEANHPELFV